MCSTEIHSFCGELDSLKDSLRHDALLHMGAFRAFIILGSVKDVYFVLFHWGFSKNARIIATLQEMDVAVELWPPICDKVHDLKNLVIAIDKPPACWAL